VHADDPEGGSLIRRRLVVLIGFVLLTLSAGPAAAAVATHGQPAVEVPPALQVPPGHELVWEVDAVGVQIYDCAPSSTDPTVSVWTFREPAAVLTEPGRRLAGIHYRGPTWTSLDGSTVVGAVPPVASVPSSRPGAIPWLLLRAAVAQGDGRLGEVDYIQRLDTKGGAAPPEPCTSGRDATLSVPYRAQYRFFAAVS
jgi:hypothetical protein